jgi:Flp pilus assembly protein TadG
MQMAIEMATLVAGIMILVGAIIAGGIIYAGLQKVADALSQAE